MKRLDKVRTSTLAAWAIITVLLALAMASPYLPHTVLHAQSVGPGGVPGNGSGSAVSSVFGRTGVVVAASGDYTAAQVTNAAATNAANTFTANQTISAVQPILELVDTSNSNQFSSWNFEDGYTWMSSSSYGAIYNWASKPGSYLFVPGSAAIGWSGSGSEPLAAPDTGLSRASQDVVAVGDGNQGDTSGTLEAAAVATPKLTLGEVPIEQTVTAPTGSCTALEWVLSNDGHLSYCSGSGGIWANNSVGTVASKIVTGQVGSLAATTIYTPAAQGIYEICGGWVVTSAGSTGASLEAATSYTVNGASHNGTVLGTAEAATIVGNTNSVGANMCQVLLPDASTAIDIQYAVLGSPTTNPTYTYWYTVIKKN